MKNTLLVVFAVMALAVFSPALFAQAGNPGTGTVSFSTSVPTTYYISTTANGDLVGGVSALSLGTSGSLVIGKGSAALVTKEITVNLRSNDTYKLYARFASGGAAMSDGATTAVGNAANAIKTGDIGFGIHAIGETSGASVVKVTGTRSDAITTGYNCAASGTGSTPFAANSNGHGLNTNADTGPMTFHEIYGDSGIGVVVLAGDRISASGDNTSTDNFITVQLQIAAQPQYWTPAATVTGTVYLTLQKT